MSDKRVGMGNNGFTPHRLGLFASHYGPPIKRKKVEDYEHNGEVRIIVPADPEKVKAWRESSEGQKRTTKQFNQYDYDWVGPKKGELDDD